MLQDPGWDGPSLDALQELSRQRPQLQWVLQLPPHQLTTILPGNPYGRSDEEGGTSDWESDEYEWDSLAPPQRRFGR